jgi:predicted mannosyl-3-phosphoglycerate phosphatase (HAD superfamily)
VLQLECLILIGEVGALIYFAVVAWKRYKDIMSTTEIKINEIVAYQDKIVRDLEKFNADFNLRFDDDLAKKLNMILSASQNTTPFMVKKDDHGNTTVVPIDQGW